MEQAENSELMQIMQFVRKYGRLIIILFVMFFVVLIGGRFWYNNRVMNANNASQIFQEMMVADMQRDAASAQAKAGQLMQDYTNSPYAQFAGLLLAKMSVAEGNLDKAAEHLRWVIDQKNAKNFARHLAVVRLVAVLLQQQKYDEAMALVANDPDKAYVALYAQARGDVYVAKGELEEARKAYMLAVQSMPQTVQQSPILQMKLLDLGGETNA